MSQTILRRTETSARSRLQLRVGALLTLLRVVTGALLISFLLSATVNAQSSSSTFTVDSTADDPDAVGDGECATATGACTLRAAIREANRNPGPDTISFSIPGDGVHTIQLTSALPALTDASGPTTIDGYTQPGSSPNTDLLVSNAVIGVEIKGNGHDHPAAGGFSGLTISSPDNTVRGLAFYSLYRQISLQTSNTSNAHGNHIIGNFIGTDATGTYVGPSGVQDPSFRYSNGVNVSSGAAGNIIGGTSAAERNVISGNAFHGVGIYQPGTDSNVVVGNLIGLDPSGQKRLSNSAHGVDINTGASYNIVGGTSSGERNIISGNASHGIEVSHADSPDPGNPTYTTGNQVIGNFIGTDVTGELAPTYSRNSSWGVYLEDKVKSNVVRENVVGNNSSGGVEIKSPDTTDNEVYDNRIGVSRGGAAIANGAVGIRIANSAEGSRIGPGNVIANNPVGIHVYGVASDYNTITRNSIYGNTGLGIDLDDMGANQQLKSPALTSARKRAGRPAVVKGTACAGCTVEVFQADSGAGAYGEGKSFVGSAVAGADGAFTVRGMVGRGRYVTATATDAEGNTSEFSLNRRVRT
jgi:CSLREA domain-containing protein